MWTADDKFSPGAYSVYTNRRKAIVVNNQRLSFLVIGLRHTHLRAPQLKGWSYNELHTNCLYADTQTKEIPFNYF